MQLDNKNHEDHGTQFIYIFDQINMNVFSECRALNAPYIKNDKGVWHFFFVLNEQKK